MHALTQEGLHSERAACMCACTQKELHAYLKKNCIHISERAVCMTRKKLHTYAACLSREKSYACTTIIYLNLYSSSIT